MPQSTSMNCCKEKQDLKQWVCNFFINKLLSASVFMLFGKVVINLFHIELFGIPNCLIFLPYYKDGHFLSKDWWGNFFKKNAIIMIHPLNRH